MLRVGIKIKREKVKMRYKQENKNTNWEWFNFENRGLKNMGGRDTIKWGNRRKTRK